MGGMAEMVSPGSWVWWFVIKYIGTMAYYGLSCIA